MKKLHLIIPVLLLTVILYGQPEQLQDPEAKIILDRVSEKIKTYETIIANFELIIENKRDNFKSTTTGKLFIKNDKFKISSPGSLVFYDGETMWDYTSDINEVTVSSPDKDSDDFIDNYILCHNNKNHPKK